MYRQMLRAASNYDAVPIYETLAKWDGSTNGVTLDPAKLTGIAILGAFSGIQTGLGISFWDTNKYYYEITVDIVTGTNLQLGISVNPPVSPFNPLSTNPVICMYTQGGTFWPDSSAFHTLAPFGAGDVLGWAVDGITGETWCHLNGVYVLSGNPSTGANPTIVIPNGNTMSPAVNFTTNGEQITANFGQNPFVYPVPTGFTAGWGTTP